MAPKAASFVFLDFFKISLPNPCTKASLKLSQFSIFSKLAKSRSYQETWYDDRFLIQNKHKFERNLTSATRPLSIITRNYC